MSPRKYDMNRRKASVEETRERILAAAREVFSEDGFHNASLDKLARRADVARATIYHHFENKLGLLDALIEDTQKRAGMDRLGRLDQHPDAIEVLRQAFDELCRFWAAEHVIIRNVMGLAVVDPDALQVVAKRNRNWRRGVENFVERLDQEGYLSPDTIREEVAAALGMLFSFPIFDQLYTTWGLSEEKAARILRRLASGMIPALEE